VCILCRDAPVVPTGGLVAAVALPLDKDDDLFPVLLAVALQDNKGGQGGKAPLESQPEGL
jgi:hypothetical protein